MRLGMTKCTPMAPVSGPLTHGVACTQPSDVATLMSLKRAVAARTLSINGEPAVLACAAFGALGPAYEGCPPAAARDIASTGRTGTRRRNMFIGTLLRLRLKCAQCAHGVRIQSPMLFEELGCGESCLAVDHVESAELPKLNGRPTHIGRNDWASWTHRRSALRNARLSGHRRLHRHELEAHPAMQSARHPGGLGTSPSPIRSTH